MIACMLFRSFVGSCFFEYRVPIISTFMENTFARLGGSDVQNETESLEEIWNLSRLIVFGIFLSTASMSLDCIREIIKHYLGSQSQAVSSEKKQSLSLFGMQLLCLTTHISLVVICYTHAVDQ